MKTMTKSKIVKIIEKNGKTRPIELARALKISSQIIHRHLKSLVSAGILEPQGSPPITCYGLAGVPAFSNAFAWVTAKHIAESPHSFVCETRDVFTARLGQFKSFKFSEDVLPLLVACVGEIGNNSFDHNLGQWRDVPGCWLEAQVTGDRLWVCVADRGQGVLRSLSRVQPGIPDDQAALEMAFEKHVSGRAPEKRGNGLKFVKRLVTGATNRGLACRSGRGAVSFGSLGDNSMSLLQAAFAMVEGTVTLMVWSLE